MAKFSDFIEQDSSSERLPQNFEQPHSEDTVLPSIENPTDMEETPPAPTRPTVVTTVTTTTTDTTVGMPPRTDHLDYSNPARN